MAKHLAPPLLNHAAKALFGLGGSALFLLFFTLAPAFGWAGLAAIGAGVLLQAWSEWYRPASISFAETMRQGYAHRGFLGWTFCLLLLALYIALYFKPQLLLPMIRMIEPLQIALSGSGQGEGAPSPWFLYGFLYSLTVAAFGIRALVRYRHSRYHVWRTLSLMFCQLLIAFTLPNILLALQQPYFEWTNIWPLRYYELWPDSASHLARSGWLGRTMLVWGVASFLILSPILTYFFGKRWYCSWVCGCAALAETLGDSFRQNSDKSLAAWRVERLVIYSVLLFILLTTAILWLKELLPIVRLGELAGPFSSSYGLLIGALFSGVLGTGLYPIFGSRVWCRFGCPMAAYLGILQRLFSRFRITTNGGQCMSCGNCSTYCEMGIDVRSYAQKGSDILRASCVGCGYCAYVCPRGVLKLENSGRPPFFPPRAV
jgi:polyferredoxin